MTKPEGESRVHVDWCVAGNLIAGPLSSFESARFIGSFEFCELCVTESPVFNLLCVRFLFLYSYRENRFRKSPQIRFQRVKEVCSKLVQASAGKNILCQALLPIDIN